MSINKVILVGNLGQDPEIRQFPNGGRMAKISLATKSTWVDRQSGERKTATEWHNVVFNGKLAEIAENYLHKGMQVYIEGSLRTRSYKNQQQQTVRTTEVVAQEMRMLGSVPQQRQNFGGANNQYQNNGYQGYQNQQYNHQPMQNYAPDAPPPMANGVPQFYNDDVAF